MVAADGLHSPVARAVGLALPEPTARRRYGQRRHYRIDSFRLKQPRVIVEHWTAGNSFRSAYDTFARDTPDVELHELPGVCSHFIVDTAGRIHQLVSLKWICRHTVGLNHTAIGIEHVGTSEAGVLNNKKMIRASLRLTEWLQAKYGISDKNVIGHAESLSSPYHRERVARLKRQTHADWPRSFMVKYRARLK